MKKSFRRRRRFCDTRICIERLRSSLPHCFFFHLARQTSSQRESKNVGGRKRGTANHVIVVDYRLRWKDPERGESLRKVLLLSGAAQDERFLVARSITQQGAKPENLLFVGRFFLLSFGCSFGDPFGW